MSLTQTLLYCALGDALIINLLFTAFYMPHVNGFSSPSCSFYILSFLTCAHQLVCCILSFPCVDNEIKKNCHCACNTNSHVCNGFLILIFK